MAMENELCADTGGAEAMSDRKPWSAYVDWFVVCLFGCITAIALAIFAAIVAEQYIEHRWPKPAPVQVEEGKE